MVTEQDIIDKIHDARKKLQLEPELGYVKLISRNKFPARDDSDYVLRADGRVIHRGWNVGLRDVFYAHDEIEIVGDEKMLLLHRELTLLTSVLTSVTHDVLTRDKE
jgi:hypothetical protein